MSKRWYGSLDNRLEEGRQFVDEIKVGDGVTEYYWSDRHPYEVTAVRDQKHITIRGMDHKHVGEAYSNEWELSSNESNPELDLTKRGDIWYYTTTVTAADVEQKSEDVYFRLWLAQNGFDMQKILEKGKQTKYRKANISIGVASYYYDYEF